ncbi:MAG: SLATT domain-containing protein [Bacteroidales bacterium]|nr:SLATT domain-containing protein [Bacteroidales bacterium]
MEQSIQNRTTENSSFLTSLIRRVKITSAVRFEAHHRMQYMKNITTLSIAMLSIYIISLNLLVFIDKYKKLSNELTVVTVVLSTFVLAVSLVISQLQYGEREYIYHSCGMELNKFLDKLLLYKEEKHTLSFEQKKELYIEYSDILKSYNLNHSGLDALVVTSKDDWVKTMENYGFTVYKTGRWKKLWIWCRKYIFDASFIYLLLIILPPILSLVLLP